MKIGVILLAAGGGLVVMVSTAGCRDHNRTIMVDAASDPRPDVTAGDASDGGGGGGKSGASSGTAGAGGN